MCVGNDHPPHEHNSDDFFEKLVQDAEKFKQNDQTETSPKPGIKSDDDLSDKYQPEEQKNRSRSISAILSHYEQSYDHKVRFQRLYRMILFWGCSGIIILFVVAILFILIYAAFHLDSIELAGVATVITSVISLVVSMLELVHIITKYCFPEKDEEYIVQIVESIQGNDLEKIKESNRAAEAREKRHSPSTE